jgi:hypothetical protein
VARSVIPIRSAMSRIDRLSMRYRGEPYRNRALKGVTALIEPEWHVHS